MTSLDDFEFLVLGLLKAPVAVVRAAVVEIVAAHFEPGRFTVDVLPDLDTSRAYTRSPPRGGAHAIHALLFEPSSAPGTTAVIPNLEDAWMTMFNAMCQAITGEHVLIRSSVEREYPISEFEIWADGVSVRWVSALKDDPSWEFTTRGEPRPFEDTSNSTRRRVADRLSRPIIVSYLRQLGWDIASERFWRTTSPALLLSEQLPRNAST